MEIKNLDKKYKRPKATSGAKGLIENFFNRKYEVVCAIEDVSLTIDEGEIVGLIGANGSGKTTLIKMMTGIIKATDGTISINGFTPYKKNKEFLSSIGVVFAQKNQLWWDLPAKDSFLLNKKIYRIADDQYQHMLDELSELFDIKKVLDTPVRNLSLGERMKCELIAALLHNPKILFLDEPTIGLDYFSQKNIREFLKYYAEKEKITIILTSHYTEDIKELCDRIVVLKKGRKAYDSSFKNIEEKIECKVTIEITTTFPILIDKFKKKFDVFSFEEQLDCKYSFSVETQFKDQAIMHIADKYGILDCKVGKEVITDLIEEFYV